MWMGGMEGEVPFLGLACRYKWKIGAFTPRILPTVAADVFVVAGAERVGWKRVRRVVRSAAVNIFATTG